MWTRRRFLGSGAAFLLHARVAHPFGATADVAQPFGATADVAQPFGAASDVAQPLRAASDVAQPLRAAAPVRLHLIGQDPGADLALDEMSRTASLLGRGIDRSAHGQAMIVDLRDHTVSVAGTRYIAAASEAARSAALAAWRGRGAASAAEWHHALQQFGAEQLNQRFTRRFGTPMNAQNWMSWMLVKLAVDAQLRSVAIDTGRFDGHKGIPLVFGPDRHLVQPLCMVDERGALVGWWQPEP